MHILVIPSWYPENTTDIAGSFFREQALALARNGCRVGVISLTQLSLQRWPDVFKRQFGIFQENDCGVSTYHWRGMRWFPLMRPLNRFVLTRQGMRLFQKYVDNHGKPDILLAHSSLYGGVIAHAINQNTGIPYVVTEHSSSYARNLIKPSDKTSAKKSVKNASCRLAVSESFAVLLQNYYGAEMGAWHYLPNMVSNLFVDFKRKTVKKPGPGLTILSVALLSQNKAIDNLLYAFERAFKNASHVTLRIGGDGPERKRLEKLAEASGIGDRIHFLGSLTREQVAHEMAAIDVFVLPSRYETFGVVLVEALAMGKPVIATQCGGPESIVRPQDGHLVPVDDINALSSAMRRVHQDFATYNSLEIRQSSLERFSETAVTTKLKKIYKEILAGKQLGKG